MALRVLVGEASLVGVVAAVLLGAAAELGVEHRPPSSLLLELPVWYRVAALSRETALDFERSAVLADVLANAAAAHEPYSALRR